MGQHLVLFPGKAQQFIAFLIPVRRQKVRIIIQFRAAVVIFQISLPVPAAIAHSVNPPESQDQNPQPQQGQGFFSKPDAGPCHESRGIALCLPFPSPPPHGFQQSVQYRHSQKGHCQKEYLAPHQIAEAQQTDGQRPAFFRLPYEQSAPGQYGGHYGIVHIEVMGQQQPGNNRQTQQCQYHTHPRLFPRLITASQNPDSRQQDTARQE